VLALVITLHSQSTSDRDTRQAAAEQGGIEGRRVAIDPGHGGIDGGVCHNESGLMEKEITLTTAQLLQKRLQDGDGEVIEVE
jgi:N-acetylmuramoyl-L-alanine amidase